MSSQPITRDVMLNIYKNGIYYNPAKKHYGINSVNVVCDRCYKNNLDICIGWTTYDLCLSCVQAIHREVTRGELTDTAIKTNMMQNQFREDDIKTFMMQNQFRGDDIKTRMMQYQFRKN